MDTDIEVVEALSQFYNIHWFIIYPFINNRYKPQDFDHLVKRGTLEIVHIHLTGRMRNPKNILLFSQLLKDIKKRKPNIVYCNFSGLPYFIFIAALILKRSNTIFAAHQAEVHEGLEFKLFSRIYFKFWYSWFTYFNLFSRSQGDIFRLSYPRKVVFITPLAPKNFGEHKESQLTDKIVFFNFGTIRQNKNIICFINAACNLYEKGIKGFSIVIKGECEDWNQYKNAIRYPELFECDIRQIDNSEIAELFNKYHYLVLPYTAVSQSGILKIALNYNVPIIASDLEGFKQEIVHGVTGYLFKNKDTADLEKTMECAIKEHDLKYQLLKRNQKRLVNDNYSRESVIKGYKEMFQEIIFKNGQLGL